MIESPVYTLKEMRSISPIELENEDADEYLARLQHHFTSPSRRRQSCSPLQRGAVGCRGSVRAFALCSYLLLNLYLVWGFGVHLPNSSRSDRQLNVAASVASKLLAQPEGHDAMDPLSDNESTITSSLCDDNADGEGRDGPQFDDEEPCVDSSAPAISERERRITKLRASQVLARHRQSNVVGKSTPKKPRPTSVGDRRVGSATSTRQGVRVTTQIMDALRKTARGAPAAKPDKKNDTAGDDASTADPSKSRMSSVTTSVIQAAVESLLRSTTLPRSVHVTPRTTTVTGVDVVSAAFSSFESAYVSLGAGASPLSPGSVLVPPSSQDRTAVYVSTSRDDYSIASLRLSVFSDFTPDMQNQFHARSCQAMQSRRLRGAVCLVAKSTGSSSTAYPAVLGSVECSFHEFFGTRLGQKRPRNSVLYVTEVAVNASVRRRGVGLKLLKAVDRLAKLRGTETVYLHVDTMNRAAIRLYEKAGYRQAISDGQHPDKVSLYSEFTRSLNLHPGATQGRDHFLLYKDLVPKPTWLSNDAALREEPHSRLQAPVGVLGFEIPA